jgi:hypothetical protein
LRNRFEHRMPHNSRLPRSLRRRHRPLTHCCCNLLTEDSRLRKQHLTDLLYPRGKPQTNPIPVSTSTPAAAMFRHGARTFATSAQRLAAAAAEPSQHLINLSKAQGVAKGLTAGAYLPVPPHRCSNPHQLTPPTSQPSATPPSSGSTTSPSRRAAKSSAKPSS